MGLSPPHTYPTPPPGLPHRTGQPSRGPRPSLLATTAHEARALPHRLPTTWAAFTPTFWRCSDRSHDVSPIVQTQRARHPDSCAVSEPGDPLVPLQTKHQRQDQPALPCLHPRRPAHLQPPQPGVPPLPLSSSRRGPRACFAHSQGGLLPTRLLSPTQREDWGW